MRNVEFQCDLPREGFVRLPVVLRVLGIGKTSWWNGIRAGRFPKPTKEFGRKTACWHVDDIRALIARCKAAAGNDSTEDAANGK